MDERTRDEVMDLLRRGAELLEASDKEVLLPGWDPAHMDEREAGIRTAAGAVLADGLTLDEGTRVSGAHLGYLVRYVADMLE
jgi:hypothetical protein